MATTWLDVYRPSASHTDTALAPVGCAASVASTTLALNSAYTYGSAGASIGIPFWAPATANLTDLAIYVVSYSGTWSNTNQTIEVQIREDLNGNGIPGTTLTGSSTIDLTGSPTGWVEKSGMSIALTKHKLYWLCLNDSDGGGTDYVTLQAGWGTTATGRNSIYSVYTTTGGWASAGTSTGRGYAGYLKIGTVFLAGQGVNALNTVTSGTYRRGLNITLDEPVTWVGIQLYTDQGNLKGGHTVACYTAANSFGGGATKSITLANQAGSGSTFSELMFFDQSDWTDLSAGQYNFVLEPGSAITTPRKCQLPGSPSATVKAALLGGNGTVRWVDDSAVPGTPAYDDSASCQLIPLFYPQSPWGIRRRARIIGA